MTEPVETHITLTMDNGRIVEFTALLQQGFGVLARLGCSLEELLCNQWGIDRDYVTSRITTIFMNNRAIDDIATAIVRAGAVVALSGAMPGLVGATMRRGGFYAAMRGAMTYQEDADLRENEFSEVRVKLFNLLLPELGPVFLGRGVILPGSQLTGFLRDRDAGFWSGCRLVRINGEAIDAGDILKACDDRGASVTIRFSVKFEG